MLELKDVTLVAIDGFNADRLVIPVLRSTEKIKFKKVLLWLPIFPHVLLKSTTIFTKFIGNWYDYNAFVIYRLPTFIDAGHVLLIQHDGYVLNPDAWEDAFLSYDYIGAPWQYTEGPTVGNGGFSLRSKKFLDLSSKLLWDYYNAEDHFLIRQNAKYFIDNGIRFAPEEVAARFSIEANKKAGKEWKGQFGFHDKSTDISRAFR